ncbi:MAG: acyltransferase [Bacteroidales bacterium]
MKNDKTHIAWVDLLRVLACFLVVLAHCCDPFVARFDTNRFEFLSGAFWGSLVRPCVPLFVMMTGVLLLPIQTDMSTFYNKRIKRIVIPLIFWSVLSPILYYLYLNSGVVTLSPNIVAEDHTLSATITRIYSFIFNFSYATIPLWYLYMLVGLYLFMPIISGWLSQASQKDVKRFLMIWGVSMCLPYIQMGAPLLGYVGNYGNTGILGVCDWNPYGTFYYFSGFMGYIVLAYYLLKYPLQWSWKKTLSVAAPLFAIGYAITLGGFIVTQKFFPGSYAALEIVWYFSGINVFMMTYAAFIVLSKVRLNPSPFMNRLASLTFGIYLCHFFIVQLGYDLMYKHLPLPAYLLIPVIALFAFTVSAGIVWAMSQNKFLKKFVF